MAKQIYESRIGNFVDNFKSGKDAAAAGQPEEKQSPAEVSSAAPVAAATPKAAKKPAGKPAKQSGEGKKRNQTSPAPEALPEETKHAGGRPSNGPTIRLQVSVPVELYPEIEAAAGINTKGKIGPYVLSLIEKDIKTNRSKYVDFLKFIKE